MMKNELAKMIYAAKKDFVNRQKLETNKSDIEFIMDYVEETIVDHVINGTITVKIKVSEAQIVDYSITESRQFHVEQEDSCRG
jgi:hypothetical protein